MVLLWYFNMTTLHGSIFKVIIKYVYLRGDSYYYQRKIPKDLQSRYGMITHIKENLKTNNLAEVAKKVTALNKLHSTNWDAMRGNLSITPSQVKASATLLLKKHGLKSFSKRTTEVELDHFIESVLEPKRLKFANGDESTYRDAQLSEFLSDIEQEALRHLTEEPKFMLSDALEFYLSMHTKSIDDSFIEYNTRAWNRFVNLVGDKGFVDATREDGHIFIRKLEASGLKTGTIRRNIRTINAIYNHGLLEKSINKLSPFKSLKIAGEGTDTIKRETFDINQLETLRTACLKSDDEARWALLMQMDLGSRIGEIVGLA